MATVGTLVIEVRADASALQSDMRQATRNLATTTREADKLDRSIRRVEGSMSGAAAATRDESGALVDAGKHLASFIAAHLAAEAALKAFRSSNVRTHVEVTRVGGALTGATAAASRFMAGLRTATKLILGRFLPGIGLLLGAAGLAKLTRRLTEFGASAASVRPVTIAFDNLAEHVGTTGEALRADLKRAVAGTVSEFDLMRSSVIALNSEVIQSPALLAELAGHARILGRTVDLDTTEALDSMIRGIGLMNPQLLKSLGVLVSVDEATRAYAESHGRAVSSLSDHERHAAFLEAALEKIRVASARVGDETDDLGTVLQQAEAASEDFSRMMRTAVAEAEGIRKANREWAAIRLILNEMRRDILPDLAGKFADVTGKATSFLLTGPLERYLSGEMFDTGIPSFREWLALLERLASGDLDTTVTQPPSIALPEGFGAREGIASVEELRERGRAALMGVLDDARDFNAQMEAALGDGFDAVQANINETLSTIEALIELGFDPASEAVRNLVAELERLEQKQALAQFMANLPNTPMRGLAMPGPMQTQAMLAAQGIGRAEPIEDLDIAFSNLTGTTEGLGEKFKDLGERFGGGISGTVRGILDPSRIGSQVVGNLLTPVIGGALAGIGDVLSGLFSGQEEALSENTRALLALGDTLSGQQEAAMRRLRALDIEDPRDQAAELQSVLLDMFGTQFQGLQLGGGLPMLWQINTGNVGEVVGEILRWVQTGAPEAQQLAERLAKFDVGLEEFIAILEAWEQAGDEIARLGDEAGETAETFREINRNVPEILKLGLRRFQARDPDIFDYPTRGVLPGSPGGSFGPTGGSDLGLAASAPAGMPAIVVQVDGRTLFEIVEKEGRYEAARGGTSGISVRPAIRRT